MKTLKGGFIDSIDSKEEKIFNVVVAKFVFGCNIPLSIIESTHFKNLICKLRPAYASHLPSRKVLSTTLLDEVYNSCLIETKNSLSSESVLVIDGWKNSSTNSKTVVTIIHNANGDISFVNAWNLSTEAKTAEKLSDIVF